MTNHALTPRLGTRSPAQQRLQPPPQIGAASIERLNVRPFPVGQITWVAQLAHLHCLPVIAAGMRAWYKPLESQEIGC